ncbi:MAG: exosortase C-terminal domain/associated protein EpsI [Aquabacterium sp.]
MSWARATSVAIMLLLFAAVALILRPSLNAAAPDPDLEARVPAAFGAWRLLPSPLQQVSVATKGVTSTDQPYDEVVSRTYVNDRGDAVMLALAYGKNQRQEVKIHRPELCYPAQGYKVNSLRPVTFTGIADSLTGKNVTGQRMVVHARNSMEVVSYWIRIGDTYSSSPWQVRWQIMKEGLQGRTTDGMLVRVSQRVRPGEDPAPHHALVESFARDLVAAVPPQTRSYLVR